MSDKFNELDENLDAKSNDVLDNADDKTELLGDVTQEEIDASNGKISLEENDNWTFEAEAPMLNSSISGADFELDVPDEKPAKPTITRVASAVSTPAPAPKKKSAVSKNDKIMFSLTAAIAVLVIAILAVLGVRYYTVPNTDEKMNPGNVALTIDGTDVSVGMYNYYYTLASQEYIEGAVNGYYTDIDPTADFSNQTTTDADGNEITWEQKFQNDTVERLKADVYNYNCAVAAGITLSDDQAQEIDDALSQLKEYASESDQSIAQYLKENFGDYCGLATMEKLLNQYYLGQLYAKQASVDIDITDDDVNAYYEKHADDYSLVKVAYLPLTFEINDEAAAAKALEQANKYLKDIKNEDDMKLLIPTVWKDMIDQYVSAGYYESKEDCILDIANNMEAEITRSIDDFIDEAVDWLFDDSTKVNDAACFSDVESGVVYIFMKVSDVHVDDSQLYSVRHILIKPEAPEAEGEEQQVVEYTDEQWAAAKKKADDVYAEFNSGDKSEASFAELAEKYSEDSGSVSSTSQSYGGLYSGVPLGQMVPEFETWSVDKSREYGDTEIVKTDYGYHIMFFVEQTESYFYQCKSIVYNERQEAKLDAVKVKRHKLALKNAKVAEPMDLDSTGSQIDDMDY